MAVYYADGLSVGRQKEVVLQIARARWSREGVFKKVSDGFSRLVGPVEDDGCAWAVLRLHDRVFVFFLEVPLPASEVVASVVRHTARAHSTAARLKPRTDLLAVAVLALDDWPS